VTLADFPPVDVIRRLTVLGYRHQAVPMFGVRAPFAGGITGREAAKT